MKNQPIENHSESTAQSDPLALSDSAEASEVKCHFCQRSFTNWGKMYKHALIYNLDCSFSLETLTQNSSKYVDQHLELDSLLEIKKSLLQCQKCQKYCLATFTQKKHLQEDEKKSISKQNAVENQTAMEPPIKINNQALEH